MKARIYRPSKNAMQSGFARTGKWVLEYEPETAKEPEPLMGWTAAGDTLGQVSLKFATLEDATAFAERKGIEYTVLKERERRISPRNYGDNFKYTPPDEEKKA